jgi:hypothetical protein
MLRATCPSFDLSSDAAGHQADSVLRLVAKPFGSDWRVLAAGIDTLDCGYHVVPLQGSVVTLEALEGHRVRAQGVHEPVPWDDDELPGMLYPGAGARSHTYRYHLETPIAHVYIRGKPVLDGTPSVLVCFNSEALWCQGGALPLVARVQAWLKARGLATEWVQPSRCDLAMDVHMPGGMSRDEIEAHLVTRAKARDCRTDWDRFKGYSLGSRRSPLFARFYDKTLEMAEASKKYWLRDVWGEPLTSGVIRFEFQLNRDFLHALKLPHDTVAELLPEVPRVWKYLTTQWCTLRCQDDGQRATRRAVLPAWQRIVDEGIARLGGSGTLAPIQRSHGLAGDEEHLRRQGLSFMTSAMAVHPGKTPKEALQHALRAVVDSFPQEDVAGRVRIKRIKRGYDPGILGALPECDDLIVPVGAEAKP